MYFYEIEVYHPLVGSEKIIMGHDECFDNHQLNIIVQEAFDECIDKYSKKLSLDKDEEACRMEVETIFEKHLLLQLQYHGFRRINITETCSIMGGELFGDGGAGNSVLKNRYKDKPIPPCRKCIRKGDGGCIVPNIIKYPIGCYIKPFSLQFDENEEEHNTDNDFNVEIMKLYFNTFKKSIGKIKIAVAALNDFFDSYDFDNVWIDMDVKVGSEHEGDIFCGFDLDTDKGEFKKLLEDYGFVIEDDGNGFWITGVKE